jgi:hypothetical protein
VRSRRSGGLLETRCWDLDLIAATNDWRLLRSGNSAGEPHFIHLAGLPHGTTVLWQNLDRLTSNQNTQNEKHQQRFLDRIEGVRGHLGIVFHRLMAGRDAVRIFVNDRPVKPWDPFMADHPATLIQSAELKFGVVRIPIRGFVLPHISKLTKGEHHEAAGQRGWLAHQGFYVYRRDRLLVAGDWLGFGWTKDEHLKLARIAIELPNTLDQEWQINVTKSRATPPSVLRDDLKSFAANIRDKAKNVYTHRGARLTPNATSSITHLWAPMAKHDRVFYQINRDHPLVRQVAEKITDKAAFNALIRLLQETIPLQHISITSTEKPDSQPEPFQGAADVDVREAMIQLYQIFRNTGHSPDDARSKLLTYSPFNSFPKIIDTIEDYPA